MCWHYRSLFHSLGLNFYLHLRIKCDQTTGKWTKIPKTIIAIFMKVVELAICLLNSPFGPIARSGIPQSWRARLCDGVEFDEDTASEGNGNGGVEPGCYIE